MTIKLTKKERIKILNGRSLYEIMIKILLREEEIDQNREHFWVVGLENNNRILFIELVSLGSINKTIVEPMEVYSLALQKRAASIILVHNHPSGELEPSEADKDITNRLIQVGKIVNTPVLDHLIISIEDFLSFKDIGLMRKLARSKKYVADYLQEQKMRKQAENAIRKEEAKKNFKEMAKRLKREGVDASTISKVTGLSEEDIKALRVRKKKG